MQSRRRRLQRNLVSTKGGKGRGKKLKTLNTLSDKERHFARSYNHMISKKVVDFAIKNVAGVIKLEMLEGYGKEESNSFILRNWSYFELQTFIEYKAKREGMEVVKIDPYHTSQICSQCGNYEEGQRKERMFECKKCENKMDADYNAAINIAKSTKIVKKKEDCEYWKTRKNNPAGPTAEG